MKNEKLAYVVYGEKGYYGEYDSVIGFTMLIEEAKLFPNEDTAILKMNDYPKQLDCTLKVKPIIILYNEPVWPCK
jgi:hypothetical protein